MKKIRKIIAIALIGIFSIAAFSGCGSKDSSKVLNIYNVGDYIDEDLLTKFEKESGIKIVYEKYDTNEIMYQKIKSGGSKYDLVFPSDYMIEKMIKENLLQKLDYNNIPNYKNIDEKFKKQPYDPKDQYSVPYFWGTFGILYNKEMVKDPVDSWDILWNEKYKGQIFMLDSVRDTMGIALMKLGYSQNSTNENELKKAKDELIKQRPLVLAYGNDDIKDRLLGGEGAMGIVYSGDAITLMEKDKNLAYAIPKTGTNKWIDAMCVPVGAENQKEAEQFINFMLDPENAKQNIDYINYSTPNKEALELLEDEVKKNPVAYPSDDIINKSEFFKDLGDKIKLYDDMWLEIKSK